MNVIVSIDGREAVPIRAIPLLTDWGVMSPDAVAEILAGENEHFSAFIGLVAYRVEDGEIKSIAATYWSNYVCRELKAVSDRIFNRQVTHEDGLSQWRRESLSILPAGAFVWRDEFEPRFWKRHGPEGETVFKINASGELERSVRDEDILLNYDPFPPAFADGVLVLEGFQSGVSIPVGSKGNIRLAGTRQRVIDGEMIADTDAVRALHEHQKHMSRMLAKHSSDEYQRDAVAADAALERRNNAEKNLTLMQRELTKARATGDAGKVADAQAKVAEAEQDLSSAEASIERLRGDDCSPEVALKPLPMEPRPEAQGTLPDSGTVAAFPIAGAADFGGTVSAPSIGWFLNKPDRYVGYTGALYQFLRDEHQAGRPLPRARDVIDAWKKSKPADVLSVEENRIVFFDSTGNTKSADIDAIQKAINRRTAPLSRR